MSEPSGVRMRRAGDRPDARPGAPPARTAALLALFAAAMALVEAAVVVYLRELQGGVAIFPMRPLAPRLLALEVAREAATIVMLASVAVLSVRGGARRMGAFLLLFAAWDVFYYLWLHASLRWPAGLADWDVLFLIPLPWVGPVWSVLLICAEMLYFAYRYLAQPEGVPFRPGAWGWAAGIAGLLAVTGTYIWEWVKTGYGAQAPSGFAYAPFLLGVALLGAAGEIARRRMKPGTERRPSVLRLVR